MPKLPSKRTKIRTVLADQLAILGADIAVFSDLLDDYMALYDVKERLIADIVVRGVTYKEVSSAGHEITKSNPSTKELIFVNKQMLAILKELGINTKAVAEVYDDDDL